MGRAFWKGCGQGPLAEAAGTGAAQRPEQGPGIEPHPGLWLWLRRAMLLPSCPSSEHFLPLSPCLSLKCMNKILKKKEAACTTLFQLHSPRACCRREAVVRGGPSPGPGSLVLLVASSVPRGFVGSLCFFPWEGPVAVGGLSPPRWFGLGRPSCHRVRPAVSAVLPSPWGLNLSPESLIRLSHWLRGAEQLGVFGNKRSRVIRVGSHMDACKAVGAGTPGRLRPEPPPLLLPALCRVWRIVLTPGGAQGVLSSGRGGRGSQGEG